MTLYNKLKTVSLPILYKHALDFEDHDPNIMAVGMAAGLLFELYGREWMSDRIIFPNRALFLTNIPNNLLDELKFQKKVLLLGESLYNLREIEGIQNVLEMLHKDNLESIIAELESGRLLFHRGLNFSYVTRNLKKRSDFDIHIAHGSNEIFCETKCKIESTIFSTTTFSNSLHKAKQQLPKDSPAIIMIKLPHFWDKYEVELKNISEMYVSKTNRSLGIVCWYDKWIHVNNTHTVNLTIGFEVHNNKSKIINYRIIPFLPNTQNSPRWKSFEQFAKGYL